MELAEDSYRTITIETEPSLFKDRGSKFYGYAFPVQNEEAVKAYIDRLKKEHHNARHWCYAWQIGKNYDSYRASDDGEPNNSAGMPIFGQLQAFNVTNILVVVVRYFGGTKLGVGGLVQAYKTAAQMVLNCSKIVEKTIDVEYKIAFNYPEMNQVMRLIKDENLKIVHQLLELDCTITIAVRKNDSKRIFNLLDSLYKIDVKKA